MKRFSHERRMDFINMLIKAAEGYGSNEGREA